TVAIFFCTDTAPTRIYSLSLHDALPISAVTARFAGVLLHWEDFGTGNARRILERHRGRICTFNDDMQGTGATVLAAALSGTRRRSEEHTSELQSPCNLVCRLLLEKKKQK